MKVHKFEATIFGKVFFFVRKGRVIEVHTDLERLGSYTAEVPYMHNAALDILMFAAKGTDEVVDEGQVVELESFLKSML